MLSHMHEVESNNEHDMITYCVGVVLENENTLLIHQRDYLYSRVELLSYNLDDRECTVLHQIPIENIPGKWQADIDQEDEWQTLLTRLLSLKKPFITQLKF